MIRPRSRIACVGWVALALACSPEADVLESGVGPDGDVLDSGAAGDGGVLDGGVSVDSGVLDSGSPPQDGGPSMDGGRFDVVVAIDDGGTAAGGTVVSAPEGIDCGETCSFGFDLGQTVTLRAVADPGSIFTGWSGDCAGTAATCELMITASRSVTARFERLVYALTIDRTGTGSGTVTSDPSGTIDCGAACTATIADGDSVTLIATSDADSTFLGWMGGGCTGTDPCEVTPTATTTVEAQFELSRYSVMVSASAGGNIESSPAGILCPGDCVEDVDHGDTITLSAIPEEGYGFVEWTGACAGETTPSCALTITSAVIAGANFAIDQHAVNVTVDNERDADGTVSATAAGIVGCDSSCLGSVDHGTSVTFVATTPGATEFAGWGGDCASAGTEPTCELLVNADTSVSAEFRAAALISVSRTGDGAGEVEGSIGRIRCGDRCSAVYDVGTVVTLTATPSAGSTFAGWGEDCRRASGDSCTVTAVGTVDVTAQFTLD